MKNKQSDMILHGWIGVVDAAGTVDDVPTVISEVLYVLLHGLLTLGRC